MARILLWDIETTHLKADFGTLLCVGYKWLDEPGVKVISISDFPNFADDPTDDSEVVKAFLDVYGQADMTVTYYGKGFDLKFLYAKALEHGLLIPPSIPMTDLFFTVKANLALSRKSLQNVGFFLKLNAEKTPVEGRVWKRASTGHAPSLKYIVDHCEADVLLLEEAYLRLRPLIRTHPRVGKWEACRHCGSDKVQSRGKSLTSTKILKYRFQCQECGSWDTRAIPQIKKKAA